MNEQRTPPYASILVPTHDRAATLRYAVRSLQQQTVKNIEILVVGDGVTPDVRTIASELAAEDSRVVFLDWPKAAGRGGDNRDRAVKLARAPRIFYCDDDDLFLQDHIETLGPVLDDCDCADSQTASVSLSGRLQVTLTNHRRGPLRDALAGGRARALFDTHFAHRKVTYERLGPLWPTGERKVVWKFLQGFARDPAVTWRTIPRVTALSFHGAARRHLSAKQRQDELAAWSNALSPNLADRQTDIVHYDWYVFLLTNALLPPPATWECFVSRCHIALDGHLHSGDVDVVFSPSRRQVSEISQAFALLNGVRGDPDDLAALAMRLMDPLVGTRPRHTLIARLLTAAVGEQAAREQLQAYQPLDPHSAEMRDYLLVRLLLSGGRLDDAEARIGTLLLAPQSCPAVSHALAAGLARRRNDADAALRHATDSKELDPDLPEAHEALVWALANSGRFGDAQSAAAEAHALFEDQRFSQRLATLAANPAR